VLISQLRKARANRKLIQKTKMNIEHETRPCPEDSTIIHPLLDEIREAVDSNVLTSFPFFKPGVNPG
jgi:hypothetical protein